MATNNAEEQKVLGMRDKPESQMTKDELRSFLRPLGIPGAPFLMAKLKKNAAGGFDHDVGVVQSPREPLFVPSEQSAERVYGKMLRESATPQMMMMTRDIIQRIQPGSMNRVFAVLGDPATGKSHEFKKIASLVHPEGALVIDCGGLNMRELFFRTVLDYGKGVKEQFDKRLAENKLSAETIKTLTDEFPGSVVEKNGKSIIDWEMIGKPRTKISDDGQKTETIEDRGEAKVRAAAVLTSLYKIEGIDVQHNSFGIKTVEGEIPYCRRTGRPLFLDEFTKSKQETLDAYQTYLDWENGNDKSRFCRLKNSFASSDGDSPAYIDLDRDDTKMGWILGIAGNESKDGITTHRLSVSMETRLQPTRIGEPHERDFAHRISQLYTGFPLTTWYSLYETQAKAEPDKFAEALWKLRTLGLTAQEIKQIPPHERVLLRNFDKTVEAINNLAQGYYTQARLANPESPLLEKPEYQKCADEMDSGYKNIYVSLRTPLDEMKKAIQGTSEVLEKDKALPLAMDFSDLLKNFNAVAMGDNTPAWHSLGANLVRVRQEAIANATVDMPFTCATLVTLWEGCGVFQAKLDEGRPSTAKKSIVDLLKYDKIADMGLGDTEELTRIRDILTATLRSIDPKIKAADEKLIPLDVLGQTIKAIGDANNADKHTFYIPNTNLQTVAASPIAEVQALPTYAIRSEESALMRGMKLVHVTLNKSLDVEQEDEMCAYAAEAGVELVYYKDDTAVFGSYDDIDVNGLRSAMTSFAQSAGLRNLVSADGIKLKDDVVLERELVDFREVLAALALPGFAASNRANIWPVDLFDHLSPDQKSKENIEPYNTLKGESKIGFDISILTAANKEGTRRVNLFVMRDTEFDRYLILGPESISPQLQSELAKQNITYATKSDGASTEAVNKFFSTGATERHEKNKAANYEIHEVLEGTLCALSALFTIPNTSNNGKPGEIVVESGMTLGRMIYEIDSDPSVFTAIVRPTANANKAGKPKAAGMKL